MDPLDSDTVRLLPLYAHASPRVFVLHPGEAVIIPQVRLSNRVCSYTRSCCSRTYCEMNVVPVTRASMLCSRGGGTMQLPWMHLLR